VTKDQAKLVRPGETLHRVISTLGDRVTWDSCMVVRVTKTGVRLGSAHVKFDCMDYWWPTKFEALTKKISRAKDNIVSLSRSLDGESKALRRMADELAENFGIEGRK